jgi:NAD(P)-dependent dehydrogenase (short-subunit alcohol dehydrogenase family)
MERSPNPSIAVVTGGSQGLGLELVRALTERGWRVVTDARRSGRLAEAVGTLGHRGLVTAVSGDIADPAHREALVAAVRALGGTVAIVINNASTLGATPMPTLCDADPEAFRRAFDVNVVAPLTLVGALAPVLADRATVVNITSDAAVEPYPNWGIYGATKAALEHASGVLAAERPDLRVLVVDPGDMRTEMHQDAFAGEDISDRPPPEVSIPGLLALVFGDQGSGRYVAREVTA